MTWVKEYLNELADQAAPLSVSSADLSQRIRRHRRRKKWLATAAPAAAASAVAVTVLLSQLTAGSPRVSPSSRPLPAAGHAGSEQEFSYHGIQFAAPDSWSISKNQCGNPLNDTVMLPNTPIAACLQPHPSPVDFAAVAAIGAPGSKPTTIPAMGGGLPPDRVAVHARTFAGQRALTGSTRLADGRTEAVLIVPGLDVYLEAETFNPASALRIVGSARSARPADYLGCPDPAPTAFAPVPTGAKDRLAPAGYDRSAVVCGYLGGRLEGSVGLRSQAVPNLLRALDVVPKTRPSTPARRSLACPGNWNAEVPTYLIRLRSSAGGYADITLSGIECQTLISNGAIEAAPTSSLASSLGATVDYPDGWFGISAADNIWGRQTAGTPGPVIGR